MTMPAVLAPIDVASFRQVLFFTGAGLSAESGVPTYRGRGGIWTEYRYEDYACQRAFERDPGRVLDFHQLRRAKALSCPPHAGHLYLARLQAAHPGVEVVTQNIDGLLQRAGVRVAAELHGSLWRQRCNVHGLRHDFDAGPYRHRQCPDCGAWLRPDITWFEDAVDAAVFGHTGMLVDQCELFVSVGTSGAVWPAAGFAEQARRRGVQMVEINPEENEASHLYGRHVRQPASTALAALFPLAEPGRA